MTDVMGALLGYTLTLNGVHDMNNVFKQALIYTGVYFVICTIFFWLMFFVHVAVLVFWKPMCVVFLILFAVLTFDHYKKRTTVSGCFDQYWAKTRRAFD